MYDITEEVNSAVAAQVLDEGLCTLYIRHTSASLLIQENHNPTAIADLEMWLKKLVPENDPDYSHPSEGPDDMPAHVRSALTSASVSIPYKAGALMLGT